MDSGQFLDLIKKAYSLETDYQLMQHMGWPKQSRITNYRNGMLFDNDACRQVAAMLHMDPLHVIACMETERAKDKERRAAWRQIAEATRGKVAKMTAQATVALFLGAAVASGISSESHAATLSGDPAQVNGLYIMLRRRRRFLALRRRARAFVAQRRAAQFGQIGFSFPATAH